MRAQGIGGCPVRGAARGVVEGVASPWKPPEALGGGPRGRGPAGLGAPACGGVASARGCARRRGRSRARARPAGQTEGGSRVAAECRHISDRGGRGIPVSCGGGAWLGGGASSGRGEFLGPAGTGGNRLATGARQVRTQVTRGPAPRADPFLLGAPAPPGPGPRVAATPGPGPDPAVSAGASIPGAALPALLPRSAAPPARLPGPRGANAP